MPLFLDNYFQYCNQNRKEARKLLFDVYTEIGQLYKEFEEYAESLEEGIRLPGVGFEIDRHLYSNAKRILEACKTSDEVDVIRRANGEVGPDCAYVVRVRNGTSQAIEIDEALADDLFAAEENLDADEPRFEGDDEDEDGADVEDSEDEDDEDCEDDGDGDREDDEDDAGGSNGGGPGNNNAGGPNTGGNGGFGGNNAGGNPNGKSKDGPNAGGNGRSSGGPNPGGNGKSGK